MLFTILKICKINVKIFNLFVFIVPYSVLLYLPDNVLWYFALIRPIFVLELLSSQIEINYVIYMCVCVCVCVYIYIYNIYLNVLTHFIPVVSFFTPRKHQEITGFRGYRIERDQWHEMV